MTARNTAAETLRGLLARCLCDGWNLSCGRELVRVAVLLARDPFQADLRHLREKLPGAPVEGGEEGGFHLVDAPKLLEDEFAVAAEHDGRSLRLVAEPFERFDAADVLGDVVGRPGAGRR